MKKDINKHNALLIMDICHIKERVNESFLQATKELKPLCLEFLAEHLIDVDLNIIKEKKLHRSIAAEIVLAVQKRDKKLGRKNRDFTPTPSPPSSPVWTAVRAQSSTDRTRPNFLVRQSFNLEEQEEKAEPK
jgi:hypothetical protein